MARLVSRNVRRVLFVGLEEQAIRLKPLTDLAGMALSDVMTPDRRGKFRVFLLAVLAEAAGLEESAVAAQERFIDLLNAAERLPIEA